MIKPPEIFDHCRNDKHWEYRLIGWGCPTCDWPNIIKRKELNEKSFERTAVGDKENV